MVLSPSSLITLTALYHLDSFQQLGKYLTKCPTKVVWLDTGLENKLLLYGVDSRLSSWWSEVMSAPLAVMSHGQISFISNHLNQWPLDWAQRQFWQGPLRARLATMRRLFRLSTAIDLLLQRNKHWLGLHLTVGTASHLTIPQEWQAGTTAQEALCSTQHDRSFCSY